MKGKQWRRAFVLGTCVLAVTAAWVFLSGAARRVSSKPLEVKTRRVIVFKDGHGMFVKGAAGRADDTGRARIEGIPDSMVLGTFWVDGENTVIRSITAEQTVIPRKGSQETEKSLVLQFDAKAAGREVDLEWTHFGPGVRWIPTYRIRLGKDGKAALAMQAEILNEAEDLFDVPLDLVVGVPNFRFKNVPSPMSLMAALPNALRQAAPQIMNMSNANVLFTQRASEFRGRRPAAPATPAGGAALPPELTAGGAQDLFVYKIPGLSLRAGQRATVPIVSARVPLRHFYTYSVHMSRSGTESLPKVGTHAAPVKLLKNDVWHMIELTNKTSVPWTTGAALVVDGYLPVAQELLTYTSVGGRCQVPLTVAVDVRGGFAEEEMSREPQVTKLNGYHYTKIMKKGTLRVTNYKKEAVEIEVTCELGGNATQASDKGEISIVGWQRGDWPNHHTGHAALNGHSRITWDLKIAPGQTRELTCLYHHYVR